MQRSILYLQWKSAQWLLAPVIVAALTLPLTAVALAGRANRAGWNDPAGLWLGSYRELTPIFPMLAVLTGVAVGLTAWAWDHREGHVYALALPVTRARYVLMKFLAGAALLALPALALWVGAVTAVLAVDVPAPLHAYPFSFGLRFLLGMLIMYALSFALAAGTARIAFWLLIGFFAFLIGGGMLVSFLDSMYGIRLPSPLDLLYIALVRLPGPFHVFGGSWNLFDV